MEEIKLKALIYGRPGAGKTTLVSSASVVEEMSPLLFINLESGTLSITEDIPDVLKTENVACWNFMTQGEYAGLQQLFKYLAFGKHPYKTLVLDSLTDLQIWAVQRWTGKLVPKNAEGFPISDDADKRQTLKIYERATAELRNICRSFRDLPLHVLMVAHDDTTEQNGLTVTHPALTPKFRDSIVGYMDLVGYLTTRESGKEDDRKIERYLTFVPRPTRIAKGRAPGGRALGVIEEPTIEKVLEKLRG